MEGSSYNFLKNVIKVFSNLYKLNANIYNRLVFWMTQIIYLTDWLTTEYNLGKKMAFCGVSLVLTPTKKNPLPQSIPRKFFTDLKDLLNKIYIKLFITASTLIRSHAIKIILNVNHKTYSPEIDEPIKEILKIIQQYNICFEKSQLCSTIVLQFFNHIYHFMDSVMFNELLKFSSFSSHIGMNLKIGISELTRWKHGSLKKYYPNQPNLFIAFGDICSFEYISQVINVLVLNKTQFEDQIFVKNLFSRLSGMHLYTLLSRFVPDELAPHQVPHSVLEKFKASKGEPLEVDETLFCSIFQK